MSVYVAWSKYVKENPSIEAKRLASIMAYPKYVNFAEDPEVRWKSYHMAAMELKKEYLRWRNQYLLSRQEEDLSNITS